MLETNENLSRINEVFHLIMDVFSAAAPSAAQWEATWAKLTVEFPGARPGAVAEFHDPHESSKPTAPMIGYMAVTPLQLAKKTRSYRDHALAHFRSVQATHRARA